MKLRNIYILCKENVDYVANIEAKDVKYPNGRAGKNVTGCKQAIEHMQQLKEIDYLKNEIERLVENVSSYFINKESFVVDAAEWNIIANAKLRLMNRMNAVIDLYESMGFEKGEELALDIKMPQSNDLTEFMENIKDLEFIITKCPFLKSESESLRFESTDVGSFWITLCVIAGTTVVTSVIINNLLAVVDKTLVIKSHMETLEQQKALTEKMNLENEQKKSMIQSLEMLYKCQVEQCITELEEQTQITMADGEERGRAEQVLNKMMKLLDKGMQFYPSINSSNEVKALFEPIEMKYISMKKTELIETKADTEE